MDLQRSHPVAPLSSVLRVECIKHTGIAVAALRRLLSIQRALIRPQAAMATASAIPLPVSFPSENPKGEGVGVLVGDNTSKRGLIVIHEWWGMNEQIQKKGAELAQMTGYLVLVPDMYRGKVAYNFEDAGHLMEGLDWDGAIQDLSGAASFLKSKGCTGVGVTGFCMGGALSFAAAARCPEISAAAPFYGICKPEIANLTKVTIPVQAHFGEKDEVVGLSSPADYIPLRDKLKAAGVPLELYTYNAGHAFTNIKNDNYNADLANLAFKRMKEFMDKNL